MRLLALSLVLAFAVTSAASGQPAPSPPSDDALAARLAAAAELADQNRRSEALNAEVNAKNRAVQARNDSARAAYDKAMADYRAALASQAGATARDQASYRKAMDDWNAAVAACKAGDVSKCDKAPAKGAARRRRSPASPDWPQPAKAETTARTPSP